MTAVIWVCLVGAALWLAIATRLHSAGRTGLAWIWLGGAVLFCVAAILCILTAAS